MSGGRSREWLTLADGEAVAWAGNPKVTTALPGILFGVLLLVGGAFVGTEGSPAAAAVLTLAGVVVAVTAYLQVVNTAYVVTDRAVYAKSGIIGVRVTEASLSKVQNSAFAQGVLGSLLGYGTVTLEVAGGKDIDVRRIDDPETVRRFVDTGSDEAIPGTTDQWRAVLSEVRALRRAVETRR